MRYLYLLGVVWFVFVGVPDLVVLGHPVRGALELVLAVMCLVATALEFRNGRAT